MLKTAKVKPLFKNDPTLMGNYRPVSVWSCAGKIKNNNNNNNEAQTYKLFE